MRPTIIIWSIVILIFIVVSRTCSSKADNVKSYNNPNRQYVAGCP
jgi:hypothetical protein